MGGLRGFLQDGVSERHHALKQPHLLSTETPDQIHFETARQISLIRPIWGRLRDPADLSWSCAQIPWHIGYEDMIIAFDVEHELQ
jgi:hypothetical protein